MANPFKNKLPVMYDDLKIADRRLVREAYTDKQRNKCMFCGNSLQESSAEFVLNAKYSADLFPAGFLKYPAHLHHDHDTGLTVGTVHARCNAYLWEHLGE